MAKTKASHKQKAEKPAEEKDAQSKQGKVQKPTKSQTGKSKTESEVKTLVEKTIEQDVTSDSDVQEDEEEQEIEPDIDLIETKEKQSSKDVQILPKKRSFNSAKQSLKKSGDYSKEASVQKRPKRRIMDKIAMLET